MPSEDTVQAFTALVESGDYVGAIERYYHADASMQENDAPPKMGRDTLVESERQVMATFASITAKRLAEPLVRGDHVAIRWQFTFALPDGATLSLEEVAFQHWRGERIAEEKFFYDPKQMGG
jgi:ketosteroid isomerase-like protein